MHIGIDFKLNFKKHWNNWLKFQLFEINWGNIIANTLAYTCHYDKSLNDDIKFKFKTNYLLRKLLFSNVNVIQKSLLSNSNSNILFIYEQDNRTDYKKQCEFIINDLKENFNIDVIYITNTYKTFFYKLFFTKFLFFLFFLFSINPFKNKFNSNSFSKYLYLLSTCFDSLDLLYYFKKNIDIKKYSIVITHADMKEFGSLIAQFAKNNKVKSATIQHSMYTYFENNTYCQAAINYENFISDYMLIWGEATKINLNKSKIDNSRFIVAGPPQKIKYLRNSEESNLDNNEFGLILSVEYLKNSNIKMIKLVNDLIAWNNILKCNILFHPSNDIDDYFIYFNKNKNITVNQNVPDIDLFIKKQKFLICHTTTVYLNCLLNNRICFRYKDENLIDIYGLQDYFESLSELKDLISDIPDLIKRNKSRIPEVLNSYYGNGLETYSKALFRILEK